MSSILENFPFLLRYSVIFFAIAGPTPGSVCSWSSVALLRLTFSVDGGFAFWASVTAGVSDRPRAKRTTHARFFFLNVIFLSPLRNCVDCLERADPFRFTPSNGARFEMSEEKLHISLA